MPTDPSELTHFINTDSAPDCAPKENVEDGAAYCIVAATTITIRQIRIRGFGLKPLVLLASDTIVIGDDMDTVAVIDVSSQTTIEKPGAGSISIDVCPGTAPGPRGGGAGGSFVGKGGAGGAGGGTAAGNGGKPATTTSVTALRGGCTGQDGGIATGGTAAAGGHGGGAVYLIAGTRITIKGKGITAVGEGGAGAMDPSMPGANGGGGGGGGAGGMILLDAPTVTTAATARLLANGGGGGGGAGLGGTGMNGGDPQTVDAASGGHGSNPLGGNGGDGSTDVAPNSPGSNGSNGNMSAPPTVIGGGGGGGGGGAGYIGIRAGSVQLDAPASPPPTMM